MEPCLLGVIDVMYISWL